MSLSSRSFSATAWAANTRLYDAVLTHPFNRQLADGTLPREAFRHYIVQDAKYLIAFAQSLAVAAARADDPDHLVQFAAAAQGAVIVERALHTDYFRSFDLDEAAVAAVPISPACHHYASFLIASGFREPLPVHAAALLPCFWVYREVGTHIHETATPQNPYRAWIDTYAGEEFSAAVDAMIATTDRLADQAGPAERAAMDRAFARAMQLEWLFWDSAYRLEVWPV